MITNRVIGESHVEAIKKPTKTPKKAPAKKAKTKAERVAELYVLRQSIAITLGTAIPIMSLVLSHCAGSLAWQSPLLALFLGVCGVSVLVVSLSHLAESISDATGSANWQAWSLAVTMDLSIVGCELSHVFTRDDSLWWWTTGLMVACAGLSICLNVYAMLKHVR